MEKTNKKSMIELLEKSYKNDTVKIEFELGGSIVVLTLADASKMFQEQKKAYQNAKDEYDKRGWDEKGIDVKEWETYADRFKDDPETLGRIEKNKPENLAEQMADSDTRLVMFESLFGKFIRKTDGTPCFESQNEIDRFGRLIVSTPKLQTLIMKQMTQLTELVTKLGEQAKN